MESVGIFFGGQSVEHDVSVLTGVMALNSLKASKYNPIPIYVDFDGTFYTGEELFDISYYKNIEVRKLKKVTFVAGSNTIYVIKGKKLKKLLVISAVINCIHGAPGEDGAISGLCELCNIPFASPDMLSSSICMDKSFTKTFLKGIKVKALPSVTVSSPEEYIADEKLGYPIIIKPNKLGSSIGISKAENREEAFECIMQALRFGSEALIEPCVEGFTEINCAVYKNKEGEIIVSECEQPIGSGEVLSFSDKYKTGERIFPAPIHKRISDKIKRISRTVYENLRTKGVIRIDYMIVDGEVYLNEINTVPGSLSYYFFADTLKGFSKMLIELIELALLEHSKENSFVKIHKSEILTGCKGKGAKTLVK